jgi:hypothetical protein
MARKPLAETTPFAHVVQEIFAPQGAALVQVRPVGGQVKNKVLLPIRAAHLTAHRIEACGGMTGKTQVRNFGVGSNNVKLRSNHPG